MTVDLAIGIAPAESALWVGVINSLLLPGETVGLLVKGTINGWNNDLIVVTNFRIFSVAAKDNVVVICCQVLIIDVDSIVSSKIGSGNLCVRTKSRNKILLKFGYGFAQIKNEDKR